MKVQLQDLSYEVFIKGGSEDEIELLLNVVDRLRDHYGINIYIKVLEDDWLYGGLSGGLKIIVCGREIKVEENLNINDRVEYLAEEILRNISFNKNVMVDNINIVNEGPGRFSSAEHLMIEVVNQLN